MPWTKSGNARISSMCSVAITFVSYKAVEDGITVKQANPQYTSRKCSHPDCGFTHEDNRDGSSFACLKCGYTLDADYNAAKNIAVKYAKKLHRMHKSFDGGVSVDIPMNSGSLTVEGLTTTVVSRDDPRPR